MNVLGFLYKSDICIFSRSHLVTSHFIFYLPRRFFYLSQWWGCGRLIEHCTLNGLICSKLKTKRTKATGKTNCRGAVAMVTLHWYHLLLVWCSGCDCGKGLGVSETDYVLIMALLITVCIFNTNLPTIRGYSDAILHTHSVTDIILPTHIHTHTANKIKKRVLTHSHAHIQTWYLRKVTQTTTILTQMTTLTNYFNQYHFCVITVSMPPNTKLMNNRNWMTNENQTGCTRCASLNLNLD